VLTPWLLQSWNSTDSAPRHTQRHRQRRRSRLIAPTIARVPGRVVRCGRSRLEPTNEALRTRNAHPAPRGRCGSAIASKRDLGALIAIFRCVAAFVDARRSGPIRHETLVQSARAVVALPAAVKAERLCDQAIWHLSVGLLPWAAFPGIYPVIGRDDFRTRGIHVHV
jgi:hypothetical protein